MEFNGAPLEKSSQQFWLRPLPRIV